jgi:hypothetical protein
MEGFSLVGRVRDRRGVGASKMSDMVVHRDRRNVTLTEENKNEGEEEINK